MSTISSALLTIFGAKKAAPVKTFLAVLLDGTALPRSCPTLEGTALAAVVAVVAGVVADERKEVAGALVSVTLLAYV